MKKKGRSRTKTLTTTEKALLVSALMIFLALLICLPFVTEKLRLPIGLGGIGIFVIFFMIASIRGYTLSNEFTKIFGFENDVGRDPDLFTDGQRLVNKEIEQRRLAAQMIFIEERNLEQEYKSVKNISPENIRELEDKQDRKSVV